MSISTKQAAIYAVLSRIGGYRQRWEDAVIMLRIAIADRDVLLDRYRANERSARATLRDARRALWTLR